MTSAEFKVLVRQMRTAQKRYYALHPVNDRQLKLEALIKSKQLEKAVDAAEISDPQNLVTDSPLN